MKEISSKPNLEELIFRESTFYRKRVFCNKFYVEI